MYRKPEHIPEPGRESLNTTEEECGEKCADEDERQKGEDAKPQSGRNEDGTRRLVERGSEMPENGPFESPGIQVNPMR